VLIGQAAVAIQKYFDEARQKAPSIIYIDEIDASCPIRQSGTHSATDNEVSAQLLQELDGVKTSDSHPVCVLASTNRMDLVDPAILQRFTEHIEIALPCVDERFALLTLFAAEIPFDLLPPQDKDAMEVRLELLGFTLEEIYGPYDQSFRSDALLITWNIVMTADAILARIACATEGKSGRELRNMVDRATMRAARRSLKAGARSPVTLQESDFELFHPNQANSADTSPSHLCRSQHPLLPNPGCANRRKSFPVCWGYCSTKNGRSIR